VGRRATRSPANRGEPRLGLELSFESSVPGPVFRTGRETYPLWLLRHLVPAHAGRFGNSILDRGLAEGLFFSFVFLIRVLFEHL
ncbi:MAG: hypothetical protein KAJ01_05460, partial [Candidatus Hydrogenedentes bacterium]|nr:hypothetical protein [Candidatus Hydrogenedentota bacterium]